MSSTFTLSRPVLAGLTLCTVGLLVYQLCTAIYRIFLHPLRKFPGPKLAAVSFLYEGYYDVLKSPGGQFTYEISRLHNLYGPVVRISPEEIHVKDSEWFDVLYTGPGHIRDKWERSNRANGSKGSVASSVPHDLHRARRTAINPFFSKRAVMQLEDSVRNKVGLMCRKITDLARTESVVDIGTVLTALTLDVISEYCYDESYGCLEQPGFAPQWKRVMIQGFEGAPLRKNLPALFQLMEMLPTWTLKQLMPEIGLFLGAKENADRQSAAVWNDLNSHTAAKGPDDERDDEKRQKTIFHGIMNSKLPPREKTIERLSDEAFVLIFAGGETTAQVSTVILVELLRNSDLLQRLRKELDDVMGGHLPESRRLEDIPLMKAVVQEGLRVAAPVTNRPMLIAPNEDLQCNGWAIPRGTPISMSFQDVLFDPAIFPSPRKFDPDRWLRAAERGERLDKYLVSFAKGSRSCVGINLAYTEMYLCIAALVHGFEMELYDFDHKRDLETVRDCFIGLPSKDSKGVRVKVQGRR
ncbi:hypothetical protein LTR85_007468 [Meristemomyces frigidus]|nr:hypothetical protein LTR85_007468 [Meristemomyces frigidus]